MGSRVSGSRRRRAVATSGRPRSPVHFDSDELPDVAEESYSIRAERCWQSGSPTSRRSDGSCGSPRVRRTVWPRVPNRFGAEATPCRMGLTVAPGRPVVRGVLVLASRASSGSGRGVVSSATAARWCLDAAPGRAHAGGSTEQGQRTLSAILMRSSSSTPLWPSEVLSRCAESWHSVCPDCQLNVTSPSPLCTARRCRRIANRDGPSDEEHRIVERRREGARRSVTERDPVWGARPSPPPVSRRSRGPSRWPCRTG